MKVRLSAALLSYFEIDLGLLDLDEQDRVKLSRRRTGRMFDLDNADQALVAALIAEANRADELSREPSRLEDEKRFYRRAEQSFQSLIVKARAAV